VALKVAELYATLGIDMAPFNTALAGAQTKLAAVGQQIATGGLAKGGFAYKGLSADLMQTFQKAPAGGGLFPQVDLDSAKALRAEIQNVSDTVLDYQKRMLNLDPTSKTFLDMQNNVAGLQQRLGLLNQALDQTFGGKLQKMLGGFRSQIYSLGTRMTMYITVPLLAVAYAAIKAGKESGLLTNELETIADSAHGFYLEIANLLKPSLAMLAATVKDLVGRFGALPESVKKSLVPLGAIAALSGPILSTAGSVGMLVFSLKGLGVTLAGVVAKLPVLIVGLGTLNALEDVWLKMHEKESEVSKSRTNFERAQYAFARYTIRETDEAKRLTLLSTLMTREAAEKAVKAIADVIQKRREDAAAIRDQIAAQIGFIGLTELWSKAMVAGARAGLRRGEPVPALTRETLPATYKLEQIHQTLKRQEADQKRVLDAIKDRLGLLPAGA
jgi:hypothetical protein